MPRRLTEPSALNATILLTLTMFLWAGNHILGRWANGIIPPMTLAFLRWSLAAVIVLPFVWRAIRADWNVLTANKARMLMLGFLGSGIYNTLQYIALTETTATNAAILNSWAPVLIMAMGAVIFGDRLRRNQMMGMGLSLIGVATVVLRGDLSAVSHLTLNRGDLVMLFGTAVWALYTTLLRTRPAISTLTFIGVTYAIAGAVNLPLAAYEAAHGLHVVWSLETVLAVAYAAVLASVVAYLFYTRGVEILGPTRSGAFIHLIPLFTSLMAIVLLGEQPALYHALGFALILGGLYVAGR
jgi:drug/metabolite transporter (DMT)-like permease